jgi:methyltransferase family protein
LEIGPGGGRWTRYLLGFRKLYVIDYYSELLEDVKRRFRRPHVTFIKNNGTDFPGIDDHSVDYLFSFGTFVHLDTYLIEAYLNNMHPILRRCVRWCWVPVTEYVRKTLPACGIVALFVLPFDRALCVTLQSTVRCINGSANLRGLRSVTPFQPSSVGLLGGDVPLLCATGHIASSLNQLVATSPRDLYRPIK